MLEDALVRALDAGIFAVRTTDRAICLLPPGRFVRDLVLDTLLGPAEDFEYVSTTAPRVPPPTIS